MATTTEAADQVLELLERTGELRTAGEVGHDLELGFSYAELILRGLVVRRKVTMIVGANRTTHYGAGRWNPAKVTGFEDVA